MSKYTFSGPKITQKAIKNTLIFFYLNGCHFSEWPPEIHVLLSPFLINVEKRSWCLNIIHLQNQELGGRIWNTYLKDPINACFIVLLIYHCYINADKICMAMDFAWYRLRSVALKNDICYTKFISSLQPVDLAECLKPIRRMMVWWISFTIWQN